MASLTVTIRRKSDGKYWVETHGRGRMFLFGDTPTKLTRLEAITLIRVDMGHNLDDYEIKETDK